jgi:hypothetical protein
LVQIKIFFLSIPIIGTLFSDVLWWLCADVVISRNAGPPAAFFLFLSSHNHRTRSLGCLSIFLCNLPSCRRCLWWSGKNSGRNSSCTTSLEPKIIAVGCLYCRHFYNNNIVFVWEKKL